MCNLFVNWNHVNIYCSLTPHYDISKPVFRNEQFILIGRNSLEQNQCCYYNECKLHKYDFHFIANP